MLTVTKENEASIPGNTEPLKHDHSALEETALWKERILADPAAAKKSAAKVAMAIQKSPLKYDLMDGEAQPVKTWTKTLQIPKFYTQEDKQIFTELCDTFYRIFEKTILAYKRDPKVRRLFRFSPELNQLILKDPGYDTLIPMLRVDIFYNEETKEWKVCEFNTDGSSAMFENNTMKDFLELNNIYQQRMADENPLEVEYLELCESWADAFLKIWEESGRTGEPSIVITDILENAYLPELKAFVKVFKNRGISCELEDIRDLDYDGTHLFSSRTGTKYNMVYRRAVTRDILYYHHDIIPFLQALKDQAALVVGDIQTQVIHSKMINEALQSPDLRSYFTDEEVAFLDEHMPWTHDLTGDFVARVIADKDNWIIKPKDSYAAKGVWAGVDVSQKLWEKLVKDFAGTDYIAQTYIHHYKTSNVDLMENPEFKDFANLTGLYVYNGKFAGVYSRLADAGIISTQYNEKMVPTLFIKEKTEEA